MWRETRILLIDDNPERRRDLAVILNFLGEDHLACSSHDWQSSVAELTSSRDVLSVLLGDVQGQGGTLELLKQLAAWDDDLPLLLIDEHVAVEWPEELRRRVLATLEMPPSYNKLLDSLHRAQVYREMYDQARERGRQRELNLFRSLVGTSRAIQQVRQMMQQVADTEARNTVASTTLEVSAGAHTESTTATPPSLRRAAATNAHSSVVVSATDIDSWSGAIWGRLSRGQPPTTANESNRLRKVVTLAAGRSTEGAPHTISPAARSNLNLIGPRDSGSRATKGRGLTNGASAARALAAAAARPR
jgi:CheY-like chemotaxis protein